ncbi:KOW domain-containing protein/G-patch_2 domain-containing protein [Cephalotus follicularis]|uniref:KOW domain-containing protein/G-patch_2 domain-containing protein n=1 Tax=Cephalotus follicularis TaxID=3775 RepID=A0A1Q3DBR8_CEPFO|nr:KOW domain-containing protein/G-patch_2 domain-containing protein [Cephalotus follicularis]
MKLSFSLPPKHTSKSNPKPPQNFTQDHINDNNDNKEFVVEFDATKTTTNSSSSKIGHVIPPISNEWQPVKKKLKNIDLPMLQSSASRDLEFELESSTTDHHRDAAVNPTSYGLNIRQRTDASDARPEIERSRSYDPVETVLLRKLKMDLDRLPDHRGLEEFEDMPVEGFGAALLAGYGWYQGRGIGRNAKGDVKVTEIKRRTDKEGLGFDLSQIKAGSNSEKQRDDGFLVGKLVRVIGGRDMGLKGTIVEISGSEWVVLKLEEVDERVKVGIVDIAHLGSKEEDKCLRKLTELKIQQEKHLSKLSDYRDDRDNGSKQSSERRSRENGGEMKVEKERMRVDKGRVSWLRSHIRVRVISKGLKGGKLYLKKGVVVDVVGPMVCDVSMDEDKELIQGVDQEFLETALPRRGGPVLVLQGKHKGAYGSLVVRNSDRETGVVRDADSQELLNVRLEQIAEYVGDPSYLGY